MIYRCSPQQNSNKSLYVHLNGVKLNNVDVTSQEVNEKEQN